MPYMQAAYIHSTYVHGTDISLMVFYWNG